MVAAILDQLAEYARFRVSQKERQVSRAEIESRAKALPAGEFTFEQMLKTSKHSDIKHSDTKYLDTKYLDTKYSNTKHWKPALSFICECKKASPSKGLIAEEFPYLQFAKEYEEAGADAISVLTEPKWFLGGDRYLEEIAEAVTIPCLRKDFTVDDYMIYEAKLLGAKAVLLICAILDKEQIRHSIELCDTLGLSALVEAHDEKEVQEALEAGARIIGVNNRNLRDFTVDTENSRRLRDLVPPQVLFVSESGIKTAEDVKQAAEMGADAVLIGETLMRAADKKKTLKELKSLL